MGKCTKEWDNKFLHLKRFREEKKRFPYDKEVYQNINIGGWLTKQRHKMLRKNLSPDKIRNLDSISLLWFIPSSVEAGIKNFKKEWSDNYKTLKRFIKELGGLPEQLETFEGVKIGQWLEDQRYLYYTGKMSEYRKGLFDSLCCYWLESNEKIIWMRGYTILAEYFEVNSCFPGVDENIKRFRIGMWFRDQKTAKLSDEEIVLLNEISPYWIE